MKDYWVIVIETTMWIGTAIILLDLFIYSIVLLWIGLIVYMLPSVVLTLVTIINELKNKQRET